MKPRLVAEHGWPFCVFYVVVTVGVISSDDGITSVTGVAGLTALALFCLSLALKSDWFEIPETVGLALIAPPFLRGSWVPYPATLMLSLFLLVLAGHRAWRLLQSPGSRTRPAGPAVTRPDR